ncbi:MAG TPA: glycohydrolase toxin TNT-related protein [Micromonosporaceae bacterium]|nr:glycohydrolase toxin TNT-related protein [Micromonosporaceae bacterium]
MHREATFLRARAVITLLSAVAVLVAGTGARVAHAEPAPIDPGGGRAAVASAWRNGGPVVRAAAEKALLGTDAEVNQFLSTGWEQRRRIDDRLAVNQMMAAGGPAVRSAAQRALNSADPGALVTFLNTGHRAPMQTDQRLRLNQMMAHGGEELKAAAQKALDARDPAVVDAFLSSGWRVPWEIDQRLRVNQIMASGGREVQAAAQRALDTKNADVMTAFIESGWAVASARDDETASISDLVHAAETAGAQAARETDGAKEAGARAAAAAEAARQAAETAAAAGSRAQNDAAAAAAAAARAAEAANQAAKAAKEAVGAAHAATAAARVAAGAAARAASAASRAGHAAVRANRAAVDAALDRSKIPAAKAAAEAARDMAIQVDRAAAAAEKAGDAAREAGVAATGAGSASAHATKAAEAAMESYRYAVAAGGNAAAAKAAADTARANANRANRAAAAASRFAKAAADAAYAARDAARRASANAFAAAKAADDAGTHAADAERAAAEATQHANAATAAAEASVAAVQQATAIYDAARTAEAEKIAVSAEQAGEAALAASAEAARRQAQVSSDAAQAAKRTDETKRLIAEALAPGTPPAVAVVNGRRVALALASSDGPWTREAAFAALGASDPLVLEFLRTGISEAAGLDDRLTLANLMLTGSEAMKKAATEALNSSDAAVAQFLTTRDYPGRLIDDRLAVNQVIAAAREERNDDVVEKGQRALGIGTGQAFAEFLATGQYTSLATDNRLKVNQLISSAAEDSELKAIAQVMLYAPPAFRHEFVLSGQYEVAQRDLDRATHDAEVSALLSRGTQAAVTALQNAQEAQEVAAKARGDSLAANQYAGHARDSARVAEAAADRAKQSADEATKSAERAAASAQTARNAAAKANAAARQASRSAHWAAQSAKQAAQYAAEAYRSYLAAHASAEAAGQDANAAIAAANQARAAVMEKAEREKARALLVMGEYCHDRYGHGSPYLAECINNVTKTGDELSRYADKNARTCDWLFPPGSANHKDCIQDATHPDFTNNRVLDFGHAAIAELTAFVAMAAVLQMVGEVIICAASVICAVVLVGGLAISALVPKDPRYDTFMSWFQVASIIFTLGTIRTAAVLESLILRQLAQRSMHARLSLMADDIVRRGDFGPRVMPDKLVPMTKNWDRYAGMTREEYVRLYWNPDLVNRSGPPGGWDWNVAGPNFGPVPNDGAVGTPKVLGTNDVRLHDVWDRFGGPTGRFLSPVDTPFELRALPPASLKEYHRYQWIQPYDPNVHGWIKRAPVAPAWGQPGGGQQFHTEKSVQELLDMKPPPIKEVP